MSIKSVWEKYMKGQGIKVTLIKVKFSDKTFKSIWNKYFGDKKVDSRNYGGKK